MLEMLEDVLVKRKLILVCAGYQGGSAYTMLSKEYEIICFADNNPEKYNYQIYGKEIILIKNVIDYIDGETDILICSKNYYVEIEEQLLEMGVKKFYVYYDGEIYNGGIRKIDEPIKMCTRCVMDNSSDKYILFKDNGECNYCTSALKRKKVEYFPNEEGEEKLQQLISQAKEEGKGKKYDCVMGISGGLDSSYLLYLGYKWGLRVLALHIDDGFDTEISKNNLSKLIKTTGYDYEVIKPDPEQYNDLTLAYMKAGVPNIAIPQDNILLAYIYRRMIDYKITYFLSGGNFALESILQRGNTHSSLDLSNMFKIHEKFGEKGIDKLEFISQGGIEKNERELGIQSPRPLNYIDYNRRRALKELFEFCGFEYYGSKHLENIFTAFVQLYWLPMKFGVDKRKSHFSSMIISDQLSRDSAIEELQGQSINEELLKQYIDIIKRTFCISDQEFEVIMEKSGVDHTIYA